MNIARARHWGGMLAAAAAFTANGLKRYLRAQGADI
jgi:hypothetical protein